MRRLVLIAAALAGTATQAAAPPPTVERVVVLMRHGVRPPTKDPAMPEGIARDPWPRWPVAPGYLTPHGAEAIRLLGRADRRWLTDQGLLPTQGCPAPTTVRTLSDSDQRTIATGDAYLAGLAPGCGLANTHHRQGDSDPLFAAAGEAKPIDPARADAAVQAAAGPAGLAGVETAHRALLKTLDTILCGTPTSGCGVAAKPTALVPATAATRPKLSGALDRASTAAQILLLEYAEGKPIAEVGWGRATAADISALSRFHATEFALLARPAYLAARNAAPIAEAMLSALGDDRRQAPKIVIIVGHDTNVAALGGLLGVHWQAPGYAADDPPPGGALIIERLRDARGRRFIRTLFRASTLEELRTLAPRPSYRTSIAIEGCAAPCRYEDFRHLASQRLADADR